MLNKETFSGRWEVGGVSRLLVVAAGVGVFMSTVLAGNVVRADDEELTTAAGKPVEGDLDAFQGDPIFERRILYSGGDRVRGPNITVAVDGTVLAKGAGQLRRSTDGGKTWDEPRKLPPGALIVDDTTGDILSVRISSDDRLWRSKDAGSTWTEEKMTLKLNEVMKWLEWTGLMTRGTSAGSNQDNPKYYLHLGASETGITLWHCEKRGRLINAATFRPHAKAHPSDREGIKKIFSCAVFSDDGCATWEVTGLFPEGITEEAALAELGDGRIYHNSRSGSGYYDKSLARELRPEEVLRREAWSDDCGQTWKDLRVSRVLPDGGGYGRGYGNMGGLVRLPVKDRDILVYSNTDTAGGDRIKMTVWASFDGAQTWPVKRLVYEGPSAYSSMAAGRPDTSSEGTIYVLFEGVETHRYHGIQVARFNLSWLLEGESTGDGKVPEWVSR